MQRRHKSQYLQEDNVWQKIWDKVRFYWEHIVKHIDNLGNTLGTHWEHDGNKTKKHIGNNKNLKNPSLSLSLSPKSKGKKNWVYWAMLQFLIGSPEISIWNITYFGIGKWQGLELWVHSSQICKTHIIGGGGGGG
jgi:hypothetical protein